MESSVESTAGLSGKVFEVKYRVRVFDEEALAQAFDDMVEAEIIPFGELPSDYTPREKIAMLIKNLDCMAQHRGEETVSFIDLGFEEVQ